MISKILKIAEALQYELFVYGLLTTIRLIEKVLHMKAVACFLRFVVQPKRSALMVRGCTSPRYKRMGRRKAEFIGHRRYEISKESVAGTFN